MKRVGAREGEPKNRLVTRHRLCAGPGLQFVVARIKPIRALGFGL
jgi:hypothetical protein